MPQTWEWVPLAQGMAEEAVRRQKQREIDAMMQRQEMANRSAMDVAGANRAAALEQMIRGKDLDMAKARELQAMKETATEKEYQTEVPALRKFMAGPGGKVFGYGEIPQDPFATEPMQPTNAELRGYAPALKAMMQAAAQHAFPKPEGDFTLGPDQVRLSPSGAQIARGIAKPQDGFATPDEAQHERLRLERDFPDTVGRWEVFPQGGRYHVRQSTLSPLQPSLLQDVHAAVPDDPNLTAAQNAEARLRKYADVQGNIHYQKEMAKPPTTEVVNYMGNLMAAEAAAQELGTFSEAEKTAFIGRGPSWSQWLQAEGSTLPVVGGLIRQYGSSQALRERYEAFKVAHAPIQLLAFGPGGKQLTPMEAKVTFKNFPTGDEASVAEYKAKEITFRKYLEAHRTAAMELAKIQRGNLTQDAIASLTEEIIQRAKVKSGIGNIETNPNAWKAFMTPGDRLKATFIKPAEKK